MNLIEAKEYLNENGYILEDIDDVVNFNSKGDTYKNVNSKLKYDYDTHEEEYNSPGRYFFDNFFVDYVRDKYNLSVNDRGTEIRFKNKNELEAFIDFVNEATEGVISPDDFIVGRSVCKLNYYFSFITRKVKESEELDEEYKKYCHRRDRNAYNEIDRQVNNLKGIKTSRKMIRTKMDNLCNKLADIVQAKIHRNCEVSYQVEYDGSLEFRVFPNNGFDRDHYKGFNTTLNNLAKKYKFYDLENETFNSEAATNLVNDFARAIGA